MPCGPCARLRWPGTGCVGDRQHVAQALLGQPAAQDGVSRASSKPSPLPPGIGTRAQAYSRRPWAPSRRSGSLRKIRRGLADGERAYCLTHAPAGTPLAEIVRAAGARWEIEECFQAAKNEAGLDHYQVRHYPAWYRHITLAMAAAAHLAAVRNTTGEKGETAAT
jgi:hypothetical protein